MDAIIWLIYKIKEVIKIFILIGIIITLAIMVRSYLKRERERRD